MNATKGSVHLHNAQIIVIKACFYLLCLFYQIKIKHNYLEIKEIKFFYASIVVF